MAGSNKPILRTTFRNKDLALEQMAIFFRITLFSNTVSGSQQLIEAIPKVSHSSENVHHLIKNMSVHNYTICLWMCEFKVDFHDSQKSCSLNMPESSHVIGQY